MNAILNGNPSVSNVRILNTETLREGPNDKASRLDIVMPLASDSDCLPITVEAETDDGTIVNVAIVDSEATAEQVQCVATVDLYSRSITQ